MSILNTIISNRHTTRVTSIDQYPADGKNAVLTLERALYDWRVAGIRSDAGETVDVDAARDAAFNAARDVLKTYNAELPEGRKLRFTLVSLLTLRDGAISYGFVMSDEARAISDVVSICKYRLGEKDRISYDPDTARALIAEYTGEAIPDDDTDPAAHITAANAADVLEQAEAALKDLADAGLKGQKMAKMPGFKAFQKYLEDTVADMATRELSKTSEELEAERKARAAYRKAHRKSESRKTK